MLPNYEFRCNDTGKLFEVFFKSYADYQPDQVHSPFTGSTNVIRIIRRVAIKKGGMLNTLMSGDESALADFENADQDLQEINTASAIPEPSTILLLGTGLLGLLGYGWRQRKRAT